MSTSVDAANCKRDELGTEGYQVQQPEASFANTPQYKGTTDFSVVSKSPDSLPLGSN
jgi:hypothetical protein